ncbi:hypothetical protein CEN50_15945 [Fischerella thermalis CCMEE 5268]|uniref:Uncharacterized protein n=2 Tax=Fischerella thermalis TaxID=372787 RepID=A0A2N6LDE1_9CYAN|nr:MULTISPECIES: hypothetical protein [Fischerella]PLZ97153.1 hypothetical protein CEN50_15945 [Fischerella thermalis CCMEE 5268]PMB12967.1 hypothetical protein CEN47_29030 [Fischerella thermalis CCMEE 5319]PMB21113.1 hypothetical protein CEN46_15050 [Fischerella thermalis CCMEE 5318]PMB48993.1 hypothetical protein CEN40_06180 [Fischerella thermalis CCMEE 5205]
MKTIKVETTDGHSVEINPDSISEIVEIEKEDPGFLGIFGGHDAKYQVNMIDGKNYEIEQQEHDKLQQQMS